MIGIKRHDISFVKSPSRITGIELTLTVGVQGPQTLYVILVSNAEEVKL